MLKCRVAASIALFIVAPSAASSQDATAGKMWNSFYAGLSATYTEGSTDIIGASDPNGYPDLGIGETASILTEGASLGAEIGRDWTRDDWVYGYFGKISASNAKGETFSRYGYADDDTTFCDLGRCRSNDDDLFTVSNSSLVTFGTRVGRKFGTSMVYVAGGIGMGRMSIDVIDDNSDSNGGFNSNSTGRASATRWRAAYTLGAGVELAVSERLSLDLSYSRTQIQNGIYDLSGNSFDSSGDLNYEDSDYIVKIPKYKSDLVSISIKYFF